MQKLLFLGVGQVALAVRARLPAISAAGTSRNPPDARFRSAGAGAIAHIAAEDAAAIAAAARDTHVVVSFPPDGETDARMAKLATNAAAIVYVSSTGVYPKTAGDVDETTPTSTATEGPAFARLNAENIWLAAGASIARMPALYGPSSGLHVRIGAGLFRMPETATNYISRIHNEDAASFVIAALDAPRRSILLAGDDAPAPLADVVDFVCTLFGFAPPAVVPKDEAARTLQGNRRVDSTKTRARFGIMLRYPSYKEGFSAIYEANKP